MPQNGIQELKHVKCERGVQKTYPFKFELLFFTTHKQLRVGRGGARQCGNGEKGGGKSWRRRRQQLSRAQQVGAKAGAKAGGPNLRDDGRGGEIRATTAAAIVARTTEGSGASAGGEGGGEREERKKEKEGKRKKGGRGGGGGRDGRKKEKEGKRKKGRG